MSLIRKTKGSGGGKSKDFNKKGGGSEIAKINLCANDRVNDRARNKDCVLRE